MNRGWTEEEINRAAALWRDGIAPAEIGRMMDRSSGAICGLANRNRTLFPKRRGAGNSGKAERVAVARAQARDGRSDAGLKKRIVNQQSRDARNREKAIAKASALRGGTAEAEPVATDDFDMASIFAVDPSSGAKGDLSRFRLAGIKSIPFVDLNSRQCKLPLIGFLDIAGPFSPCCGADTGDVLRPYCTTHVNMLRAA